MLAVEVLTGINRAMFGLAAVGPLQLGAVRKATAAPAAGPSVQIKKNICTDCPVGGTVTAGVQNGVWIG